MHLYVSLQELRAITFTKCQTILFADLNKICIYVYTFYIHIHTCIYIIKFGSIAIFGVDEVAWSALNYCCTNVTCPDFIGSFKYTWMEI